MDLCSVISNFKSSSKALTASSSSSFLHLSLSISPTSEPIISKPKVAVQSIEINVYKRIKKIKCLKIC
jgi:hypothetical protein